MNTPAIRFSERMSGYVSDPHRVRGDFDVAYELGRAQGTSIQFEVTTTHPDLPALLEDPASAASMTGTVLVPLICPSPLDIVEGTFILLEPHPEAVEQQWMRYRMHLRSRVDPAQEFVLEGHKVIRVGSILSAWKHTTTLYVTVYGGATPNEDAIRALGVMHISLAGVHHLLAEAEVTNVDRERRDHYLIRFGAMFVRSLWPFYGGALHELGRFAASANGGVAAISAPPASPDGAHESATIRLCDPSGTWHPGDSAVPDACSRLIRYEGGVKGPVMLASGFGMSARSFLVHTDHPSLVAFLVDVGYDTWLFDYRGGIDLPSADTEFTIDDIAHTDWPRAVDEVLRITGARDVQVFGHCVGSVSLLMALLDGTNDIKGKVRSAVCAQFSLHPSTSKLKILEADLHLGNLLEAAGVRHLHPDNTETAGHVALDLALRAIPLPSKDEACELPVCRWINAVFGLTHRHAQLDDRTHQALPEMFGLANIRSLEHLGLMMQKGRAVDARGRDRYLRRPDLLQGIPIHLIAGERNYIFHPDGTRKTLRWLQERNDPTHYTLRVLPEYAHLDAIIGRHAAVDVFPDILRHLDRHQAGVLRT